MVLNAASVNRDDHTEIVGFLLPENGTLRLAPAYDVTHSLNPEGAWTQRHQMPFNGKTEGSSRRTCTPSPSGTTFADRRASHAACSTRARSGRTSRGS